MGVDAHESAGLEVRGVEWLREHYALTLRAWVANLEREWEQAVSLTSAGGRSGMPPTRRALIDGVVG